MNTIVDNLKKGELTIIGSRPAMGKTTFAMNLAQELTLYEDEIGKTKNRMDVLMAYLRGRHCRTINYGYDKALKNYHKGTFITKYISTIK